MLEINNTQSFPSNLGQY